MMCNVQRSHVSYSMGPRLEMPYMTSPIAHEHKL